MKPWKTKHGTLNNNANPPGTMKNQPGTSKHHKTIKNPTGTLKKHKKRTWNHKKTNWNHKKNCFELASTLARVTSIKSTKRHGVSEWASERASDKGCQWSDSGPIKMHTNYVWFDGVIIKWLGYNGILHKSIFLVMWTFECFEHFSHFGDYTSPFLFFLVCTIRFLWSIFPSLQSWSCFFCCFFL